MRNRSICTELKNQRAERLIELKRQSAGEPQSGKPRMAEDREEVEDSVVLNWSYGTELRRRLAGSRQSRRPRRSKGQLETRQELLHGAEEPRPECPVGRKSQRAEEPKS